MNLKSMIIGGVIGATAFAGSYLLLEDIADRTQGVSDKSSAVISETTNAIDNRNEDVNLLNREMNMLDSILNSGKVGEAISGEVLDVETYYDEATKILDDVNVKEIVVPNSPIVKGVSAFVSLKSDSNFTSGELDKFKEISYRFKDTNRTIALMYTVNDGTKVTKEAVLLTEDPITFKENVTPNSGWMEGNVHYKAYKAEEWNEVKNEEFINAVKKATEADVKNTTPLNTLDIIFKVE